MEVPRLSLEVPQSDSASARDLWSGSRRGRSRRVYDAALVAPQKRTDRCGICLTAIDNTRVGQGGTQTSMRFSAGARGRARIRYAANLRPPARCSKLLLL